MFRPNKNKVRRTFRQQLLDSPRSRHADPLGSRQVRYTRPGRMINPETGERAPERDWLVTATKRAPWTVRARNRRNNQIARQSRKRNRHA